MLEMQAHQKKHQFHLVDVILRVEVKEHKVDLSVSICVKGYVSSDATVRHIPYPGGHLEYAIWLFEAKLNSIFST